MKNIIVIKHPTRSGLKHIEFKPEKHTVIAGQLCEKSTLKPMGQVIRVYSE